MRRAGCRARSTAEGVGVVLLARVELQGQVVAEAVGHVLAGPARVHAPQFAAILRGRHPFTLQINDFLEIKCAHTQYVKIHEHSKILHNDQLNFSEILTQFVRSFVRPYSRCDPKNMN